LWERWQEMTGRVGLIRDDGGRFITFLCIVARRNATSA
jgi:hypothetical protein